MPKSATRVLRILEYVAQHQNGCTHTKIANELSIPKASLTALLKTLRHEGYVRLDPETGRFTVGISVLALANSFLSNLNLARMGAPIVRELYHKLGLFSVLAVPQGTDYVIICAESAPALLTHSLQIGHRGPLFCSSMGHAIMAYLPEREVQQILDASDLRPLTSKTICEPSAILASLKDVRSGGVAWMFGQSIEGIDSVCSPIFDWTGCPAAGIGIAAPSAQIAKLEKGFAEECVRSAAHELSELMGWQGRDEALPSKSA